MSHNINKNLDKVKKTSTLRSTSFTRATTPINPNSGKSHQSTDKVSRKRSTSFQRQDSGIFQENKTAVEFRIEKSIETEQDNISDIESLSQSSLLTDDGAQIPEENSDSQDIEIDQDLEDNEVDQESNNYQEQFDTTLTEQEAAKKSETTMNRIDQKVVESFETFGTKTTAGITNPIAFSEFWDKHGAAIKKLEKRIPEMILTAKDLNEKIKDARKANKIYLKIADNLYL